MNNKHFYMEDLIQKIINNIKYEYNVFKDSVHNIGSYCIDFKNKVFNEIEEFSIFFANLTMELLNLMSKDIIQG